MTDRNATKAAPTFEDFLASYKPPRVPWRRWLWQIRRAPRRYRRIVREVWVRGRRGWAPSDVWDLDGYLARVIGETLNHLADTDHGWPECEKFPTMEDWRAWLRQHGATMLAYEDARFNGLNTYEEEAARLEALKQSLRELAEHWGSLWD